MSEKLKFGESIVDAAIAKLKAGWATRLATVNSDYAAVDQIQISAPRLNGKGGGNQLDGSDFYTAMKQSVPLTPAVFVMEGPMDTEIEGGGSFVSDTKFGVYILEGDADTQVLGKKLQRQARVAAEVMLYDAPSWAMSGVAPFSGQDIHRVYIESTRPGRAFDPEGVEGYQQFYLITFGAKQTEPGR